MLKKVLVTLLVACVLVALGIQQLVQQWEKPLLLPEEGFVLNVVPGDSLRSVAGELHDVGVLQYPLLVILYGRWTGLDQTIKPGEYLIAPPSTPESLLALLSSGDVIQYRITIPEGITLAAAIGILSEHEALQQTLSGPDDPRILELVAPHAQPEGLFFPDTYRFSRNDTDWSILQRAHSAMNAVLHDEWQQRAEALPYESPYDALVMASIVERETGLPEEREEIAGVFVRRLELGMLLQTDPTVIYGMGAEFDGNLKRTHLKDADNHFNTYRHAGLPPTPIALPGRAAIHAALNPADGDYLYFVARGDGGHVFSTNLSDHNRAVRAYQLSRKADYRSTPEKTK